MLRLPRKGGKTDFVKKKKKRFCIFLVNYNAHFCLYIFKRVLLITINHIYICSPKSKRTSGSKILFIFIHISLNYHNGIFIYQIFIYQVPF